LLLIATWLAGCQLVLGDFEVEEVQGRTAQCSDNYRCNGPWLFCETKSGDDYRLIDTCASEVQCDSMAGRCTVCMPGEFRCAGARLESCNVDGTAWDLVRECPTADQCNLNSRSCRVCVPGEMPQCQGADQRELVECGPDSEWVSLGVCATPLLCQRSTEAIAADPMAPRQCVEPACPEPGAFRCEPDGVSLSRCAPDLTAWTPVDICASADLCTATLADPIGADARGGKCLTPGCFPAGAVQCVEERLERCPDSLVAWTEVVTCAPPYQCNTNAEACTGMCQPGDLQCSGPILQRCSDAQLWEDAETCVNTSLCQVAPDPNTGLFVGGCLPPRCEPAGSVRCIERIEEDQSVVGVLERCNTEQTDWVAEEACATPALCNATDERCEMPGCPVAGTLRCNPTNPSELQSCPDTLLNWDTVTVCAQTEACNTDPLGPPCINQCPNPPRRCSNVAYETCSGVTGVPLWTGQATCATADLCNCGLAGTCAGTAPDGFCGTPVCGANLGNTRCVGSHVETCQPGRNGWNTTAECGTAAMCIPGTAAQVYFDGSYCAVCSAPSERQCNGTTVRTCSADRRAWISTAQCPIGTCVNSGTMDYCAECAQGNSRCTSGDVQTCGTNSLWSGGTVTDCGAFACVQNGNTASCGVCNPGQTRCQNGDVQTCAANSSWGAVTDCGAFMCLGTGDARYCGVCTPGDTRCVNGDVQTCGTNSLWGTVTDCGAFMCLGTGNARYCGECTPGQAACHPNGIRTCGTDSRWGAPTACGALGCIDDGTADYCAECTPGQRRCVSGSLETCGADSQWGAGTACGTFGCIDSGTADYCGECAPNSTECQTAGLRTCGADSRWDAPVACGSFGCFNSGTSDYCGECTAGHARCTTDETAVETCGSNLLWGAAMACGAAGCVNSGNADFCAECTTGETRCSGGGLQTCSNSSWGASMACAFGCANLAGNEDYCGECAAGDSRCTAGDTELCAATTLLWTAGADCGAFDCYDPSPAAAYCGECTPEETACSSDETSLRTCGTDGRWGPYVACETMACVAGACTTP
jgi:hypothetical protein